ncbi:flagellar basal-body MS-ring/collar protein FliF [Futiania mangrovi]|uniref:Flagellar M-ring protein n=1 Tax=Futiania mangrovi TaxID=2959716 RepID=A0A9J6PC35_9PROT|nr:flagellar basal-body MS-ring/collar protein FliF [Futiania mangrovii]MCP1336837.1 flagellar M-ring protein FliF [Futiania mangrovii]
MTGLVATVKGLPARGQVVLAFAVIATLGALALMAARATAPAMELLYAGLDGASAGEVVGELDALQIPYEVRGDAIYVAGNRRDRARMTLAARGLPRQGQAGYEILDGLSGFGTTSEMFDAAYWRAKEGELARTIVDFPDVKAARVHIAHGDRRPFRGSAEGPSASVAVTMEGGAVIDRGRARAVRYLVALAVPGLEPKRVSVLDGAGTLLLAPGADDAGAGADAGVSAAAASARETRLTTELTRLLEAHVGKDRARVTVTVETNPGAETVVERTIDPTSRVAIHTDTQETAEQGKTGADPAGAKTNQPGEDVQAAPGSESSSRTETRERVNYEVSEVRRERTRAAGAVERISVAVLVDAAQPAPAAAEGQPAGEPQPVDLASLTELVKAAVGFDADRGDMVSVQAMRFADLPGTGTEVTALDVPGPLMRNLPRLVESGLIALVALALLFFVVRPLMASGRAASEPAAAPAAAGTIPQAALAAPQGGMAAAALTGPAGQPARLEAPADTSPAGLLTHVVSRDPDAAADLLKQWLNGTPEREHA